MEDREMTLLEEANRVFDLEESYLEALCKGDPTISDLSRRLKLFRLEMERRLGPRFVEVYRDLDKVARRLMAEMMFKLGYLYAKTYPVDEVLSPRRMA